ncbi:MAG TPA: hypothetical protein PLI07_07155, partial [Candidatus Hydrogenedentes bacterium]|nr:hypothetical protein [Candidatus Hydrogenedentota bacterium]
SGKTFPINSPPAIQNKIAENVFFGRIEFTGLFQSEIPQKRAYSRLNRLSEIVKKRQSWGANRAETKANVWDRLSSLSVHGQGMASEKTDWTICPPSRALLTIKRHMSAH